MDGREVETGPIGYYHWSDACFLPVRRVIQLEPYQAEIEVLAAVLYMPSSASIATSDEFVFLKCL